MAPLGTLYLTDTDRGKGDPLSPALSHALHTGHRCARAYFTKASEERLLQPLSSRALQHRISVYADDVVIFLKRENPDMEVTMDILNLFGEASSLKDEYSLPLEI
jgi:hypothetical protein